MSTPALPILQGLPANADQAMQPAAPATINVTQNPAYAATQPRVPAANPPARPADQQDQDQDEPDIHPVDAMASAFIGHLIDKDQPARPNADPGDHAPGSFASKLAGAASALGSGLGDARPGGDPSKGHGWLGAVGATLDARNQRVDRENQQKFENDQRLKSDQINIATANANLRQHALAIQQAEKTIRDQGATSSAQFVDSMRDNYKVQDKISQDQLNDMVAKDPSYLQTHTGRITGYEPVYGPDGKPKMDAKGVPVESPLWSLVDLSPGDLKKQYTVTPTIAKKWADAGLQAVPAGTMMPASAANNMDVQAERYGTTLGLLNLGKVQPLPAEVKDQMVSALKDPEVQHAVAMTPGSPLAGLYDAQTNIQGHITQAQSQLDAAQKSGNPDAVKAAQAQLTQYQAIGKNVDATINNGFTDGERKDYAKQKTDQVKEDQKQAHEDATQAETHRHNSVEESLKAAEVSGTPEALNAFGGKLADATATPDDIPKRAKNVPAYWDAADKASWEKYGKPFDGAQSRGDFAYYRNNANQNTIKMINGITAPQGSLDIAMKAAASLPGLDEQTANKVFNLAGGEFGNKAITDFHTSMLGLADEYSKVMGGGAGSDTSRQQALDLLKAAYSKGQMGGAAEIIKKDIAARKKAVIGTNRYLQKQYYGSTGITATMIAPDGKTVAEVPAYQTGQYTSKGARMATKADYDNGTVVPQVPAGQ